MNASKHASGPDLKSDLKRVDSHVIRPDEYEELPELTGDMLRRGAIKRAGRPLATDPRRQVTIRLPESILAAWKASGPGWQTRMAALLSKRAP
ncbi:BrnA antitoxin family protein [Luteimonas arsenica]|uniref:BrnA antitoxin family protein n=1 Tax=Luteimonas arsenica TaxID=1586242 RepID=UPI00105641D9|nr:BrnA antitoxin family protein [Luteimonas arsenica]